MKSVISSTTLALALLVGAAHVVAAAPLNDPKDPAKKPDAAAPAPAAAEATEATEAQSDDPDTDVNLAQPDFTLVALPTTLRLPRHKSATRFTHRFGRPLGEGNFGDLAADLFGFDSGATIGLEYRFGLFKSTQVAVHRTNNRTIQFLLQRQFASQDDDFPVSIDAFGSAEGTNNFQDSYSPAVGLIVSHEFGDRATIYAEPFWVNNTNPQPKEIVDDNDSFMVGLGTRVRLSATVYGVFEFTPRLTGYDPGDHQVSFGVEKRAGGHSFQLNIGNAFGTTFAEIARGGTSDWFIGFNLSRKFY